MDKTVELFDEVILSDNTILPIVAQESVVHIGRRKLIQVPLFDPKEPQTQKTDLRWLVGGLIGFFQQIADLDGGIRVF